MPSQDKSLKEEEEFVTPTKVEMSNNSVEHSSYNEDDDSSSFQEDGDKPTPMPTTAKSDEPNKNQDKVQATPAAFKRRQASSHLVINSPTDHIFSPISSKLLHRKKHLKD